MEESKDPKSYFADLILPVPLPQLFTYRIPEEYAAQIAIGSRVVALFGPKKVLTGVVSKLHHTAPTGYRVKDIVGLLDDRPSMTPIQLDFARWIAQYYLCTTGEVIKMALPSGLKISSQSKIQLNPDFNPQGAHFSESEQGILHALEKKKSLTYQEAAEAAQQQEVYQLLQSLVKKGAIFLYEEIKEKYQPRLVKRLRINKLYREDNSSLEVLLKELESHPKQLDLLLAYLEKAPLQKKIEGEEYVDKSYLLQVNRSSSPLLSLMKKGVLEEKTFEVSRLPTVQHSTNKVITLSEKQKAVYEQIKQQLMEKDAVLLHGITGSGKTEIYIQLIKKAIEGGGTVLYLLPEIALTTQIVRRLQEIFGEQVGVYHSKYADNERVEVWNGVLEGRFSLIVGARSAIFLPFQQLGLVIIDEEHDPSYKQQDRAPRYHGRDASLVLAQFHQAKVLLGSATPAISTYYNAQKGKYGFIELKERFRLASLPKIELIDIALAKKKKIIRDDFSQQLLDGLQQVLDNKEQAIIFQNRRGYAPYVVCEECQTVPQCSQCAVSLTYHQTKHYLGCHYCGYRTKVPSHCQSCHSARIKHVGYGTEKLEEALQSCFPNAKIQRMDLDTTRQKKSYDEIISAFGQGETDILVGTQMVTKGFDFGNVSLVGILDIDRMTRFPDFRANERCFQLVTQVSGRAGRRDKQGIVYIQTMQPKQPILQKIVANDYLKLYRKELDERRQFGYPPFVRLIKITLGNKKEEIVKRAALDLCNQLRPRFKQQILGPQPAIIPRIRDEFLMEIWIKLPLDVQQLNVYKSLLLDTTKKVFASQQYHRKRISIKIDVDPN